MTKTKSAKASKSRSKKATTRVRQTNTKPKSSKKSLSTSSRDRKSARGDKQVTIDRRRNAGRRQKDNGPTAKSAKTKAKIQKPTSNPTELDSPTLKDQKLERRAKVNRRRQIDPTTCERDYTAEEIEFMNALDDYKRKSGRMFPTCSEVLEVIRTLGYVQLNSAERAARNRLETDSADVSGPDSASDQNIGSETEAVDGSSSLPWVTAATSLPGG